MKTVSGQTARIFLDTNRALGDISPLLWSGFAEHLGRCVYGGIYDPGSPRADERGLRRDVLAALRELNVRATRYPGGNFVSGYRWLDGVGPKERRPRRRELAWQSIETNQFGTDEFMTFCQEVGSEPMLAVNLGTGTLEEAAALVEYCNAPAGTQYADLRVANGRREPYGVKYWCLGNEMDGPWQIAHLDMNEYARKAREAAKMMKWQDPSIKLVLCGSSGPGMSTFPEWDRVTLEQCWEHVDYLSMHYYAGNPDGDTASYLATTAQFEDHVDTLAATLRYVKARLRSKRDVRLSWDEWGIAYNLPDTPGGWREAPPLAEQVYTLEDALVAAQWMNVFVRKCAVLEIACLAQIVNVLAPILTTTDGLVKQTIFYPFALFSRHAAGRALDALTQTPRYPTRRYGDAPLIDVSACHDPQTGRQALFIVNRSQMAAVPVEIVWQAGAPDRLSTALQLAGDNPKAANTFARPDAVRPRTLTPLPVRDGMARLDLPPLSFTVLAG